MYIVENTGYYVYILLLKIKFTLVRSIYEQFDPKRVKMHGSATHIPHPVSPESLIVDIWN